MTKKRQSRLCFFFKHDHVFDFFFAQKVVLLIAIVFSNDNLINLNENFETEKRQNSNLINLEFKIRSADSIVALCERNDYSIFKKMFDFEKLEKKIDNPKQFIESINFLKCFDISLKNDNEKMAKYLLKILGHYTFNFNIIGDTFNKEFLDNKTLEELDSIEIIKELSKFFSGNESDTNKYRNGGKDKTKFEGEFEFFLDMERKLFDERFFNVAGIFKDERNNFKTFNEIFLRIFLGVFFQFKWYEVIGYYFDQCKKYDFEVTGNLRKEFEGDKSQDENEFWPFFCFNKVTRIKYLKPIQENQVSDSSVETAKPQSITELFYPFFFFKLIKSIEDESIRKKFLNQKTFQNLVNKEWRDTPRFIYYTGLLMYVIFLALYSINIEIYNKNEFYTLNKEETIRAPCIIFLFFFLLQEIVQIIYHLAI